MWQSGETVSWDGVTVWWDDETVRVIRIWYYNGLSGDDTMHLDIWYEGDYGIVDRRDSTLGLFFISERGKGYL